MTPRLRVRMRGSGRRRDVALLAAAGVVWLAGYLLAPDPCRVPLLYAGIVGWGVLGLWAAALNVPRWYLRRRPPPTGVVESTRTGEWWEHR